MKQVKATQQFKADAKQLQRNGFEVSDILYPIQLLAAGEELAPHFKDHALRDEWQGYREFHMEPDWLVIYRETAKTLLLVRTGSHKQLFGG